MQLSMACFQNQMKSRLVSAVVLAPLFCVGATLEVYSQSGCADCEWVRESFLPEAEARFGTNLESRVWDIAEKESFLRLLGVLDRAGVEDNESVYLVLDGAEVLAGRAAIERDGLAALERLSGCPAPPPPAAAAPEAVPRRFLDRLTVPAILLAGLADGFNPCAFSIVIFLAGALAAGGRMRRARIVGGWTFCAASYATYVLMGLGLVGALRALEGLRALRDALFLALALALLVLSALSFRDAFRYRRERTPKAIALQLPDGVKRRIREFSTARWSGPAVVGSSLVCGFVVTLLDSLCTGQIYIPVLALLARDGGSLRALLLLLLYNAAFIAPLVAIFLLAAYGADAPRMSRWSKRNVFPSKLFLGAMFLAMAVLLAAPLLPRRAPAPAAAPAARAGESTAAPRPAGGSGQDAVRKAPDGGPASPAAPAARPGPALPPLTLATEPLVAGTPESRRAALRALGRDLPEGDAAALLDLVRVPEAAFAAALSAEESHALRNDILDILLKQRTMPAALPRVLVETARDRAGQDEVWRDYCVQGLGDCAMCLPEGSVARAEVLEDLASFLPETGGSLAGTALLGLDRASAADDAFTAAAAVRLALDAAASPESRAAALLVAAGRGATGVLPEARVLAQIGDTLPLRLAAAAAVADLGEAADLELLLSLAETAEPVARKGLLAVADRLQRRLAP